MTAQPVLVLGARSDIAQAIARRFAASGHPLQLAARDAGTLEPFARELADSHGVAVTLHDCDVLDSAAFPALLDGLPVLPQVAICAVGLLGDQAESARDMDIAARVMRVNFEGPALLLGELANRFEARGSGTLVGISSVAGERGRASNYVYGAAKAGMTAFLSGLRNRLAKRGVHVVTVLPGFVATKMTAGMDLNPRLTAAPDEVAEAVHAAVLRGRSVIYVRPIWRTIMLVIRAIPERLFRKMSI